MIFGETSKARKRRTTEGWFAKFAPEDRPGIDIGCQNDPLNETFRRWDLVNGDGDATFMDGVPSDTFCTVYASHVLEHIQDPVTAVRNWHRICKPGGHVIIIVPHRDLYERKRELPSMWNQDHKWFYLPDTMEMPATQSLRSIVSQAIRDIDIVSLRVLDEGWEEVPPGQHSRGEYSIEVVIQKSNQVEAANERALVFCTSHIQSDPSRYAAWAAYYESAFEDRGIDLLMVNDGDCDASSIAGSVEVAILSPHLGRNTINSMPGWRRSFYHALRTATEREYRFIGHVESDCWIVPDGIPRYLGWLMQTHAGWRNQTGVFATGWCSKYGFPETGIMVLNNEDVNRRLLERYSQPEQWQENVLFEDVARWNAPAHMLKGDRFENDINRLDRNCDYVAQIHLGTLNELAAN